MTEALGSARARGCEHTALAVENFSPAVEFY
jgi:hypothetical protein